MKRVKSACICQTLQFILKDDIAHDEAAALVKNEVERYKASLDSSHIKYRILEETIQPDDSIVLKLKKQYNQTDVGDYLD